MAGLLHLSGERVGPFSFYSFEVWSSQETGYQLTTTSIRGDKLMDSSNDISGLQNLQELKGVLVCDALMPREGIVAGNPK